MIRPGLLWSVIMTKRCYQTIRTNCYLYGIKRENTFKISAYRKAAQSLELDERPLEDISDVTELKGIGKGVAEVIMIIEILNHNIHNYRRKTSRIDSSIENSRTW